MKKFEEIDDLDGEFSQEFSPSMLLPVYGDMKFWRLTERLEHVTGKEGYSLSEWKWPTRGAFYSIKYASLAFMSSVVYDLVNSLQ